MKQSVFRYSVVFFLFIISAGGLMYVSHHVQKLERDIAAYERTIEQEEEKIRVLKAEWAYLNDPARLEVLAAGAFHLTPVKMQDVTVSPAEMFGRVTTEDSNDLVVSVSYNSSQEDRQGGRE